MSKLKFKAIRVYFKDGKEDVIPAELWDDYEYVAGLFVVINHGAWIAIYNMSEVACVVVDVKKK